MTMRVGNITVDCDDVLIVAQFWSRALGRALDPGASAGYASLGITDAARVEPAWCFEKVPESKVAKNRVHVDLTDSDPGLVDRLVGLGATVLARHDLGGGRHGWTVLQDPEGNEFCVAAESYTG